MEMVVFNALVETLAKVMRERHFSVLWSPPFSMCQESQQASLTTPYF